MHTAEEQPWDGGDLLEEITVANVADLRQMRQGIIVEVTVCHIDVPEGVSVGAWAVQASFGHFLQAFGARFPEFLHYLEVGVSEAGSAPLSPAGFRYSVDGERVALKSVVWDCQEW